jgi:lipoprotein-anchoring transpeptidase ErfK/SrfK
MLKRIAVALSATIGAGAFLSSAAEARPELVSVHNQYSPGTILVKTGERRLYLILDDDHAMRYPVGVKPQLPDVIPGGSPRNPMGVAAMTLAGGQYAIHGTNVPGSVGGFVSYGCIRMLNGDITDLYQRVEVGTTVVVTR